MRTILVTGALGQIGSELVPALRERFGVDNVVATDLRVPTLDHQADGPFEYVDCTNTRQIESVVPRGDDEIRFQLSADHTDADLDQVLDALESFPG